MKKWTQIPTFRFRDRIKSVRLWSNQNLKIITGIHELRRKKSWSGTSSHVIKKIWRIFVFQDTYREKAPSNKTPALTKSTNVGIWALVQQINSLQEVLRLKKKIQKNIAVTAKTLFFVIGPFCSYHFICLNISFWHGSFVWKWCVFNVSAFN